MEEKESKHLECTVTEEGAAKFISILAQNEEDEGYVDVECSSIVGDDRDPVFDIIGTDIKFKNYALKILRKSEYVVCDAQYEDLNEIKLKIRNNFAVSKGSGYTVEIDHNLKVDSRVCKEIEDICIQYQLNIEWRPKDLISDDYRAL